MNVPALRIVGAEPTLDELAAIANHEHQCAVRSAEAVLEHARRAGEALLKAKAALPHGKFMDWRREHCTFSHRSATSYMVIARRWEDFKVASPSSLTAALAEIALERVVEPSASDLADDALKADERQMLLWPDEELPLSPRDPAQERELLAREDRHDYRCPRCAAEWSGDKRPALRGALAPLRGPWRLPNRKYSMDA